MKRKTQTIECPCDAGHKGLSIHVVTTKTTLIRMPVENGKATPSDTLMRDVQLAGDNTLIRYSDVKSETRVAVSGDEMKTYIYCPRCEKMYDLPKGVNILCNDVD